MKTKLTTCKTCGCEIARDAQACPKCGAPNPMVKAAGKTAGWILLIAIIIIVIAVLAGSGEDEPEKIGEISQNKEEQTTESSMFHVGDIVELTDIVVKFISVEQTGGSTYNQPTEGNIFVLCEFEIVNQSESEVAISTLLSFEAYCDDYACNLSFSALLEKGNKNQLDGTIAPGKKLSGIIGYEVPEDWNRLEIQFTPDFWSGNEIVFVANNN